jgi:hypothetical protein
MDLIIYPRLRIHSKKALLRPRKKWGHPKLYSPQGRLIDRLKKETGLSEGAFWDQFEREKAWLLEHRRYFI